MEMGIKLKICFKTRDGNRKTVYARLFVPTVHYVSMFAVRFALIHMKGDWKRVKGLLVPVMTIESGFCTSMFNSNPKNPAVNSAEK